MPTREDLKYYQSLPLELKIAKTNTAMILLSMSEGVTK